MFAHVVPNRRLPKQFSGFTYEVPHPLKVSIGQFVIIPLRKQKIIGLVTQLRSQAPTYTAKAIESDAEASLPEYQIKLFEWMSEKYHTSFASVLQTCLPEAAWPSLKKSKEVDTSLPIFPLGKTNSKIDEFTKQLLTSQKPVLVLEKSNLPKKELLTALKKQLDSKQILYVVPETSYTESFENFPIFHGELKSKEKKMICKMASDGYATIFCGTRAALFLPFKNLGAIVIDYEHNSNYQEKRSPKYHALEVALKIAEINHIPLIIISATPRAETFHEVQAQKMALQKWEETKAAPVQIVDMGLERYKGNKSIFSEEVMEKISRNLALGNQILVFTHRTGQAGALLCKDCGNIFKCSTCNATLAVHSGSKLECHNCKAVFPLPGNCPKCGNLQLKELGFGTQAVTKEINKIYGKANIIRLDSETKKNTSQKELEESDFIVATSIIEKPYILPKLRLAIAVMPDSLLQFPHFRASERVMQILTHVRNLVQSDGEMIIQTFLPEQKIFGHFANNACEDFYDAELSIRKSLKLPPYS